MNTDDPGVKRPQDEEHDAEQGTKEALTRRSFLNKAGPIAAGAAVAAVVPISLDASSGCRSLPFTATMADFVAQGFLTEGLYQQLTPADKALMIGDLLFLSGSSSHPGYGRAYDRRFHEFKFCDEPKLTQNCDERFGCRREAAAVVAQLL